MIISFLILSYSNTNSLSIVGCSIIAVILLTIIFVFSIIKRKSIVYVFEYTIFYKDVLIDRQIDEASKEYDHPLQIVTQVFKHIKYAEITSSGKCKLCEAPLTNQKSPQTSLISKLKPNCDPGFYSSRTRDLPILGSPTNSLCSICFENPPNCFFLPCGNTGLCIECAMNILKTSGNCHLCRAV